MTLIGYVINAEGTRGVLNSVAEEADDLGPIRESMCGHMESLIDAAKATAVSTALSSVWNDLLALQAEAAESRIANGISGMRQAVNAYVGGDSEMMSSAQTAVATTPELTIDDAIVVEEG